MAHLKWRLAELMDDRGLKVADMVKLTGLSNNTVLAIYRDSSTRVDKPTVDMLAAAPKVQPTDLFANEE